MPKQQTDASVSRIECSFCGTEFSTRDTGKIVAGPNVFICRDCIGLCIEAVADKDPDWREQKIKALERLRNKPEA